MHNLDSGPSRESDRLIVVLKYGNLYGAKEPDHKHALNEMMETNCQMTLMDLKIQNLRTKLAYKAKHRSQRSYRPSEGMSYYAEWQKKKKLGLVYL